MNSVDYLYLMLIPVLLSIGQILFKKTANAIVADSARRFLLSMFANPYLWSALFVYGAATLLWVFVLSRVELGKAMPFMALTFVIAPAASAMLFDERLDLMYWTGVLVIVVGVCIAVAGRNSI